MFLQLSLNPLCLSRLDGNPPRAIKILVLKMYYLNIFQYLLNLLQSLLYSLYGIKVSKGYPSPPRITSQHRVSPYNRRRNPSLTVT